MVGKTKPITKADRERLVTIKNFCGCLPCLLMGVPDVWTTIEHSTEAGRRPEDEHQWTIGLCGWHHFGYGTVAMIEVVGPSLAQGRKIFEAHFGDELDVLVPVQDYMLELFAEDPWPEYNVPRGTAKKIRKRWKELRNASASI